jgi:hypothetical protein
MNNSTFLWSFCTPKLYSETLCRIMLTRTRFSLSRYFSVAKHTAELVVLDQSFAFLDKGGNQGLAVRLLFHFHLRTRFSTVLPPTRCLSLHTSMNSSPRQFNRHVDEQANTLPDPADRLHRRRCHYQASVLQSRAHQPPRQDSTSLSRRARKCRRDFQACKRRLRSPEQRHEAQRLRSQPPRDMGIWHAVPVSTPSTLQASTLRRRRRCRRGGERFMRIVGFRRRCIRTFGLRMSCGGLSIRRIWWGPRARFRRRSRFCRGVRWRMLGGSVRGLRLWR